jgi:regulator of sigma E protease
VEILTATIPILGSLPLAILPELPLTLAITLSTVLNILYVALGLGLVIFFHELGHFAVAKWCNVHVERFSIGFGPILWSFKKGETEYALSAVPFGGYVKMLGQDDMDPSQLTTEEIAQDPRAYSAKSVGQRMAIISAGVIMNVLTAVLFFALAFGFGVRQPPAIVGNVQAGMPAWEAGLQPGDRITRINGHEIETFVDSTRRVALSSGAVVIEGERADGAEFATTMHPDEKGRRRIVGVAQPMDLRIVSVENDVLHNAAWPGTPAAAADPPFRPGDRIRKVGVVGEDGATEVVEPAEYADLQDLLARHAGRPIEFHVEREAADKGDGERAVETATVVVDPNPFRTLGLWMEIGRIVSIQKRSPAEQAGLKPGDRITRINGRAVGTEIDPLELPNELWSLHGQEVEIVVTRPQQGGDAKEMTFRAVPADRPGWSEQPAGENTPLSVPALGIAYHVIPTVLHVLPDSPGEQAGIRVGERIRKVELLRPKEIRADGLGTDDVEFEFSSQKETNWAAAFWEMQLAPQRKVRLTVSDEAGNPREVEIEPRPSVELGREWHSPSRGLAVSPLFLTIEAEGFTDAMALGVMHTRNTLIDTYLIIRALFTGRLSIKELRGPVGIAVIGYELANVGLPALLLFLGMLSVNLAVINFLPIPVLDGGHMVFLIWEAVTRRKPSERVVIAATYAGMIFILCLMVFVLYLDIFEHGLRVR